MLKETEVERTGSRPRQRRSDTLPGQKDDSRMNTGDKTQKELKQLHEFTETFKLTTTEECDKQARKQPKSEADDTLRTERPWEIRSQPKGLSRQRTNFRS